MTRTVRSLALAMMAALFALTLGVPAALAAPALPWESISLNLSTDADTPLLMVSGKLPDSTPLPATIVLAVPAGAEVQWAGEVLGGDPSADPTAQPTKTTKDGQDLYTFTLTKARIAQIEAVVPPAIVTTNGLYSVNFSQVAFADAPEYVVAIQVPQAAQLSETPTGTASLAPGPTGYRYYQQSFPKVKAGDPIAVAFSYTLPAGATTGTAAPAAGGGSSMLVPILLVGVALLLGAALVVGVRRKMNPTVAEQPSRPAASKTRKPATATVADDDEGGFSTTEAAPKVAAKPKQVEVADEEDAVAPAPRNKIALFGTLAIVAALLVVGVIAVSSGGAAKTTEDAITKVLAGGEACTQAQIPLAFPEGTDTTKAAEELFAAIATVPSVTQATVRLSTSSMEIGYCNSEANEEVIRAALAPTGYVSAITAPAPSTDGTASALPSTTP